MNISAHVLFLIKRKYTFSFTGLQSFYWNHYTLGNAMYNINALLVEMDWKHFESNLLTLTVLQYDKREITYNKSRLLSNIKYQLLS